MIQDRPNCEPPSHLKFTTTLRSGDEGTIVLLKISQSNIVHSVVNGGTYIRAECQNRQLNAIEITNLCLRRGTQSALDVTVDVPIELLRTKWWYEYAEYRELTRPFHEQLRHLGFCKADSPRHWAKFRQHVCTEGADIQILCTKLPR